MHPIGCWFFLAFIFHIVGSIRRDGGNSEERGIFVVPGLGRIDRLLVVRNNILTLLGDRKSGIGMDWDCVVYVYAPRMDTAFWEDRAWDDIKRYCSIVENTGKKVTENMYMLQPALIKASYSHVFLLLDDILAPMVPSKSVHTLDRMLDILRCNQLTVLSPLIRGANKGGGQKFRNIMQTPDPSGGVGFISSFVEIFAWLMTASAYEALWNLLCPEVNPYAWGYDFWYDGYARSNVPGHKMGIASQVVFTHEQKEEADGGTGRTDNTKVSDKWNAVMAQERHYQRYRNISLAKLRKQLDLRNTSWNGAVKGYLHSCT